MTAFGVANFRKFKVLTWKTLIVKRRHYIESALDIIVPSLLFIVLVVLRYLGGGDMAPSVKPPEIFYDNELFEQLCDYNYNTNRSLFMYTPLTKAANDTAEILQASLDFYNNQFCSRNYDSPATFMGGFCNKLAAILVISCVRKFYRHYFQTLFQILIMILLFALLCLLDQYLNASTIKEPIKIKEQEVFKQIDEMPPVIFCFTPNNSLIKDLLMKIRESWPFLKNYQHELDLRGVKSEDDIIRESSNNDDDEYYGTGTYFYGGVVFENFEYGPNNSIPDLKYKLRLPSSKVVTDTDLRYPEIQFPGPGYGAYKYETFAMFQMLIDYAYIELSNPGTVLLPKSLDDLPKIDSILAVQQLPYPEYLSSNVSVFIGFLLPLFTVLSFAFIVPPILKRIVEDKRSGAKELMKMMGLPSWMSWLFYFFDAMMSLTISLVIMIVLVCAEWKSGEGRVVDYSNPFLLFVFLFVYSMALVAFLFAISTLFNNPNLALTAGVILHIVGFSVASGAITDEVYANMGGGSKIALSLYPNIGLWWGIKVLSYHESNGVGVQWSNLFSTAESGDPISMGVVWIMLLVNILIYSGITWYLDKIKPGPYGVAQKWYFLFQASFWRSTAAGDLEHGKVNEMNRINKDFFEPEPESGEAAGIVVNNLRKVFKSLTGTTVTAVDSVSFKAYKGQITALLGHNGAGKTTTMNVLTGMMSASGGSALINGHSIHGGMSEARKSLGLCPQHNMLFSDLTVEEHMIFFGMLKGVSMAEARRQANSYIESLDFSAKKKAMARTLSGGMKRKLHLGIALIGDSKVVMLDEPTSGMDPEARRHMWDLLQGIKKERTILLTTHFMEEADVLGDRVVIMAHGTAQCNGSPLFLKRLLGDGYTLTMTKGEMCDPQSTSQLVKEVIRGASLKVTKSELIFNLPVNEVKNFPRLFERLDSVKKDLDVFNIGIKVTTMEDVFLKIGSMMEDIDDDSPSQGEQKRPILRTQSTVVDVVDNKTYAGSKGTLTSFNLALSQFKGLLVKRFIYTKRRYFLYFALALVPVIMAIICQVVINYLNFGKREFPSLVISKDLYEDAIIYYHSDEFSQNYADGYGKYVDDIGELVEEKNFTNFILTTGKNDLPNYRRNMVASADYLQEEYHFGIEGIAKNLTKIKAYYNSIPLHALPLSVNLAHNGLLKMFGAEKTITVSNHPLPDDKTAKFEQITQNDFINPDTFLYALTLTLGLSLFASAFLLFPLVERITNAKQVQMMTGVNPLVFWGSNLVWDVSLLLVSTTFTIILLEAMDGKQFFSTNGAFGTILLLFVLHGLGAITLSYVLSFLAKSPATGFTVSILLNILAGCIAPIAVWLLRTFGKANPNSPGLISASDALRYIFSFFPSFPFAYSIIALVNVQTRNNVCINNVDRATLEDVCLEIKNDPGIIFEQNSYRAYLQCCGEPYVRPDLNICNVTFDVCHTTTSVYTWDKLDGININLLWQAGTFFFYMAILVMIEMGFTKRLLTIFKRQFFPQKRDHDPAGQIVDEDVVAEKRRVEELLRNPMQTSDSLLVSNLFKQFGIGKKLVAVNGLTFGVKNGECFGLLGVNGAGKTTTFRMLTGDELMTDGTAHLLGISMNANRRKYLAQIGYCPQFDSIIDVMTGREMLTLFARLRGMRAELISDEVNSWLNQVGITEYADRQCGTYSGGNKRKLNVAQALIADPPIIFLDEPSSGVDPASRRKLWKIIRSVQKKGQSIILTSHSMEECDELCGRLGIMVNGQFQCFGPTRYLKNKFGQGFTILAKLNTIGMSAEEAAEAMNALKSYVTAQFESCFIKDEHRDYVHFHVANPMTPWAYLFSTMEKAKEKMPALSDYSVSETTLEQVFISFAKHQRKQPGED